MAHQDKKTTASAKWTGREKALVVTTVVCLIAAVIGFALYAGARVPSGTAAKINDFYVKESDVAQMISEQRSRYNLNADADFAAYLLAQGMNVYTYRQGVINQIALNRIIDEKARELGCTPSDSEVDEQIQAMRDANSATDDEGWKKVLDGLGVTEESLRAQLKTNLAEQHIYNKEVKREDATDSEVRAYIASSRAGKASKHSLRATFSGNDAKARAQQFRDIVSALGDSLDASTFSLLATKYSDSPSVAKDGGDAGWTYLDGSTSYASALANLAVGSVSEVIETETEGNYGVAYCDKQYVYPSADEAESMDLTTMPSEVLDEVREAAADSMYKTKCNEYLAALLSDASFTYYPIPKGAVYNVDMNLASMAAGTYLDDIG